MPISRRAFTECGEGDWPSMAPKPADITRKSPRPFTAWRNRPSAIGLRQTFPVHKKRIVFIKTENVKGGLPEANRQCESLRPEDCLRPVIRQIPGELKLKNTVNQSLGIPSTLGSADDGQSFDQIHG